MSGPRTVQAIRSFGLRISAASAGKFDGTGAVSGAAGLSTLTKVRSITFAAVGNTQENSIRIMKHDGSAWRFLFSVKVEARTAVFPNEPWTRTVSVDIGLPGTGYHLGYSQEKNDAIDITEELDDF